MRTQSLVLCKLLFLLLSAAAGEAHTHNIGEISEEAPKVRRLIRRALDERCGHHSAVGQCCPGSSCCGK
ncbi:hypothetical protein SUGI_1130970 [Cryptomeria japonica]|nr:hypothetical protein SUGI_1130970 [Cryptomeria japonica]